MPYDPIRRRLCLVASALFLAIFSLNPPDFARAQSAVQNETSRTQRDAAKWGGSVETLVDRIAALAQVSEPASLDISNISSLNADEVSAIAEALRTELGKRLHLVPDSEAKTQVIVTLSEGATGYVWVAQVRSGSAEQAAMVSIPKQAASVPRGERPAMSLQRKLVWSQPQPFLDFAAPDASVPGDTRMIVLEPTQIDFYISQNGNWVAQKPMLLQPAAPFPRDVRGMIWHSGGDFEMLVPGESCSGMAADAAQLSCAPYPSTNPLMNWPLVTGGPQREDAQFQSNRNFFDGLAALHGAQQSKLPPFYTAAVKSTSSGLVWLLAGLDGKARLYDSSEKLAATFSGWGDDVATIDTGCNDSWQVLASGAGDSAQPDHIQIYEIHNYPQSQSTSAPADSQAQIGPPEAVAVGQPLEFSGPVLALWASADLKSARVVSLNLQTGMYEGSIISVSCGQ